MKSMFETTGKTVSELAPTAQEQIVNQAKVIAEAGELNTMATRRQELPNVRTLKQNLAVELKACRRLGRGEVLVGLQKLGDQASIL